MIVLPFWTDDAAPSGVRLAPSSSYRVAWLDFCISGGWGRLLYPMIALFSGRGRKKTVRGSGPECLTVGDGYVQLTNIEVIA